MSKAGKKITGLLVITLVLALTGSASAASAKFAGTVRTLDCARGSLALEDGGPWIGKAETQITLRTVVWFRGEYKETIEAHGRAAQSALRRRSEREHSPGETWWR